MATITMYVGQEDPAYVVTWLDSDGELIDFTSHTFTLKVVNLTTGATALTKTTNITGAATAPNISVAWTTSDMSDIGAGSYALILTATTGGRDRTFNPGQPDTLIVKAAPS